MSMANQYQIKTLLVDLFQSMGLMDRLEQAFCSHYAMKLLLFLDEKVLIEE